MKRSNLMITVAMVCVLALTSVMARAEKVIYDGLCSPNASDVMDESTAFMLAVAGLGKLTITDIGSGIYHLKATTGKETLVSDFVRNAKVVSSQKVTFDYKTSDGKVFTLVMTPEELDMAGKLKLILMDKDEFAQMVKALGGAPSASGKSSGKSQINPKTQTQKPSAPAQKKYYRDNALLRNLNGPMGIVPANPQTADYDRWKAAIDKSVSYYRESSYAGMHWFSFNNRPASLVGRPAECRMGINIRHYTIVYQTTAGNQTEAQNIFNDLAKTLEASGISLKQGRPSGTRLRDMEGKLAKGSISVTLDDTKAGKYDVVMRVTHDRDYSPDDYEVNIPASASLGGNIFGISGLSIAMPFERIKSEFRNTLSPATFDDKKVATNGETGVRTIKIPLQGAEKARGLKSTSLSVEERDGYRTMFANMGIWYQNDSERFSIDQDKMREKLYDKLISEMRKIDKGFRKTSLKDLAPYGFDKFKAKAVWVADYGTYRDYYILATPKSGKYIYIISVFNK